MTKVYAFAAAVFIVALLGGMGVLVLLNQRTDEFAQCSQGAVGGDIGGPFTLVSENGETVTEAEVMTQPSLVYFGYTFCPDVCPLDASRNAEAVELLEEEGMEVQPIFVTIDPERDTPEVLAEFTDYLHPRMLGLTGSPEQVRAASQAYKTFYQRQPSEDDEFYLVDHSTMTYLMLPEHGFVDFFRRDVTAEAMAERTACFLQAS